MDEQRKDGSGLRLKGDYSQPVSGYDQSTFGKVSSSNAYGSEGGGSYEAPDSSGNVSNNEPYTNNNSYYDEPYTSSHSDGFIVMDDASAGVMTGAFFYMFLALLVTGIVALFTASSETMLMAIFSSRLSLYLIIGLEFAIVLGANSAMKNNNAVLSAVLFFAYAVVNGLTFSVIFLVFQMASIQMAFFSTAVVFGIMAFIGKVTNKDLSSIGSMLIVGLLGTIIVSVVNMFIGSSMVDVGISIVTIVIFLGLTAYDTQKIERMATENSGYNPAVISLWGAMKLYLDFINLFLKILRLFGKRK